ncbi:MAG: class I SAM-dependent methyltransferase family protein [Candidatus Korarchaeota archaeon]|nr:class I SAM-dependent methyltransferase family protein [Candidatus Korarchaeota archaeon]
MGKRKGPRVPYDLIGSRETGAVAIVEVPEGMDPEEATREVMSRHPHVKSVLLKAGAREGEFRVRPLKLLAGSEETEVIHKEHGYRIKLDPRRVYFSPRESTERQLVAESVRDGELVLVMFAGAGPYAIAIAKRRRAQVVGIELNPIAVRYFQENVILNRVGHLVFPVEGDVAYVTPAMYGRFDRVIMPLPKGAYAFISHALRALRGWRGVIHFYYWGGDEALSEAEEMFRKEAASIGLEAISIGHRIVSSYAPRVYKVRVDFLVRPLNVE